MHEPVQIGLRDLDSTVRDGLFDLMWDAWFATRDRSFQQVLVAAVNGDENSSVQGALAMSGDILKLMKLDVHLAAIETHPDARIAVAGLQDGLLVMHLPPRLERVVRGTDADRSRLIGVVRDGLTALSQASAIDAAATLSFLVEAQPIGDGSRFARTPFIGSLVVTLLASFGLPTHGYDETVNDWVAAI